MKISFILMLLLLLNTSVLLAETIGKWLANINIWVFVIIEFVLAICYLIQSAIKDGKKITKLNLSDLNIFDIKNKKSA